MQTEVYALKILKKLKKKTAERLLPFVHETKQTRIRAFHIWEDSLRTLFADLLIRHIIINKTNLKNEELSFSANEHGKPRLNNLSNFHFNLAHSGSWVICAIASKNIGVDIEKIVPIDLEISKNYFSKDEHFDLMKKADKTKHFFTLWTLKESYIKQLGRGLSLPLNSFSICFRDDDEIRIESQGKTIHDIFFARYAIDNNYKMAVCAQSKNFPGFVIPKTTKELLESFLGLEKNKKQV
jgi:4'-phosphopantetheinyl transferase